MRVKGAIVMKIIYDILLVGGVISYFILGWLFMTIIHQAARGQGKEGAGYEAKPPAL